MKSLLRTCRMHVGALQAGGWRKRLGRKKGQLETSKRDKSNYTRYGHPANAREPAGQEETSEPTESPPRACSRHWEPFDAEQYSEQYIADKGKASTERSTVVATGV